MTKLIHAQKNSKHICQAGRASIPRHAATACASRYATHFQLLSVSHPWFSPLSNTRATHLDYLQAHYRVSKMRQEARNTARSDASLHCTAGKYATPNIVDNARMYTLNAFRHHKKISGLYPKNFLPYARINNPLHNTLYRPPTLYQDGEIDALYTLYSAQHR